MNCIGRPQELFARHFFEGTHWHAAKVNTYTKQRFEAQNPEITGYDACYSAGACIEMFIYGTIILYNPIDLIQGKSKKKQRADRQTLTNLVNGTINIENLINIQADNAGTLLHTIMQIWFNNDSTDSGIGMIMRNLLDACNDVVHRNHLVNDPNYTIAQYCVFRDYIRNNFTSSSLEYQSLFNTGFYDNNSAMIELLKIQIASNKNNFNSIKDTINFQRKYIDKIGNIKSANYHFLEENKSEKRASQKTTINQCPICEFPCFMTEQYNGITTAWFGEPNNSPSTLITYLNYKNGKRLSTKILECPACGLTWTDDTLSYYEEIGTLKSMIAAIDTKNIKSIKTQILNLVADLLNNSDNNLNR